jgi:hypothetical protein
MTGKCLRNWWLKYRQHHSFTPLAIALFVLLRFTTSDYAFGIFKLFLLLGWSHRSKNYLRCSRRVGSSCSTSGTRRVNLVTNPVISHEWVNDREVLTTSGIHSRSLVLCVCFVDRCLSFCTLFFWLLCCLFFFNLRILIIPSNSSSLYICVQYGGCLIVTNPVISHEWVNDREVLTTSGIHLW